MKKIYSAILLFAFLVGMLQPILPMIEYHLFEGSITELIATDEASSENFLGHELQYKDFGQEQNEPGADKNLLDTDYYPLALDIVTLSKPDAFFISSRYYLPNADDITSPTFLPNPPPPRLS